ncbi:hypothetical protein B0T17DRAFT_206969 [Bombardia bombarda]|uniref:Uncharacterized protein n=1 Tax=Bombardia bombarda TaxID=252184 RepID=A0AA39X9W2_9PEZI|nr:hypothetical protein B0T17DRAFT_206969 [Bombardia bombarda]
MASWNTNFRGRENSAPASKTPVHHSEVFSDGDEKLWSEGRRFSPPLHHATEDEISNTGFENVDLDSKLEKQDMAVQRNPRHRARKYFSSAAWWHEEYWCAIVCVITAACLTVLLQSYDNKVVPDLGGGLQIDTAIIALVSIVRVTMKAFVEAAVSQGAWIWVSEMSQRRSKHNARLSDFKIFDEASRGL